jgi:protein ImuA
MSSLRLLSSAALPADLPHVWQGRELAGVEAGAVATGHAALDAQLPGGGWPFGLVEVLQERAEQHVWQLTGPALACSLLSQAGPVVLVAAPFEPFVPSLQAQGIAGDRLLWIRAAKPAERLWATEQALRCAEVAAVLAWLPQAKSAELRRLQTAAQQHKHLLFVFRTLRSIQEASPARVRLQLSGSQQMEVRILKRRGPPLEQPLQLAAHPARLAALLEARKRRSAASPPPKLPAAVPGRRSHVLDRIAAVG